MPRSHWNCTRAAGTFISLTRKLHDHPGRASGCFISFWNFSFIPFRYSSNRRQPGCYAFPRATGNERSFCNPFSAHLFRSFLLSLPFYVSHLIHFGVRYSILELLELGTFVGGKNSRGKGICRRWNFICWSVLFEMLRLGIVRGGNLKWTEVSRLLKLLGRIELLQKLSKFAVLIRLLMIHFSCL